MPQKPFAVVPHPFTVFGQSTTPTAGYPAAHLAEFRHVGLTWRVPPGVHSLNLDFGRSMPIDFFSMPLTTARGNTTFSIVLSDSSTFTPALYVSPSLPFISPFAVQQSNLYSNHHELPSLVTARYARINIDQSNVGPVEFDAPFAIFGQKQAFANYYNPGFGFGIEDLGDMELTRWGVPDETEGAIFRTLSCTFGWMTQADMDERFRPLVERLGKRGVALFCFDPEPTVNRQARTYFGWLTTPPVFTGAVSKFDRYESEWRVLSMI